MESEGDSIEDFLDEIQQEEAVKPPPVRKQAKNLVGGVIEEVVVKPEAVQKEVIRMMKVLTITRTPTQRIVDFQLTNSAGKLFDITIDEATARAIAALFDNP